MNILATRSHLPIEMGSVPARVIKQAENESRVESDATTYGKCRLGTEVIIDRRIGGVSKKVINTSVKIFEGAEAN